ncbi:MAG: hypothetical protein AB1938_13645 [Myxococcota bacterium]
MTASPRSERSARVERGLNFGLGALLLGAGVYALVTSGGEGSHWRLLGAGVAAVLGLEAVVSAVRNRRSLLGRLGPLP